jgi:hypothetical protein
MSILPDASRNAARNAINALADGGAGTYPTLRYQTAADADLLVVNLDTTKAIADAVAGVSTFNPPDGEASWVGYSQFPSGNGTVAKCVLTNRAGTVVETYNVGLTGSSAEVKLDTLTMATTTAVQWSAAPTVQQLASYTP